MAVGVGRPTCWCLMVLMTIACERRDDAVVEPAWLVPTTSISLDTGGSRMEESVEVRIEPKSIALRTERGWVEATLDDIAQRLKEEGKHGDAHETGREPIVAIDAAPDALWFRVASVLDICKVWFHYRVLLKTDKQTIAVRLPPNRSWDDLPIPGGARLPMTVRFNRAATRELPHGTWVLINNRWSDLESLRTRVGEASAHISQRPAVAVLDIDPSVPAGDVTALLRVLIEADILRYFEKLPEPPGDD